MEKRERMYRLTASHFYDIFIRINNFKQLAERIYHSHFQDLSKIPSIAYGVQHENVIRNFIRNENNVKILRKVGLVSNPYYPFLGASPDGLYQTDDGETLILEIKCVFNPDGIDLEQLSKRSNFCLSKTLTGEWKLKHNHRYYHQIQGQLALSNLTKCRFVLFYKYPNCIHSEIIKFDNQLWTDLEIKVKNFYVNDYLLLITTKLDM